MGLIRKVCMILFVGHCVSLTPLVVKVLEPNAVFCVSPSESRVAQGMLSNIRLRCFLNGGRLGSRSSGFFFEEFLVQGWWLITVYNLLLRRLHSHIISLKFKDVEIKVTLMDPILRSQRSTLVQNIYLLNFIVIFLELFFYGRSRGDLHI